MMTKDWPFEDETKEQFLERIRKENVEGMFEGMRMGWWEGFDNDGPFRIFEIDTSRFEPNTVMAHVVMAVFIFKENGPFRHPLTNLGCPFKSIGDARKKGWNKPITKGEHRLKGGRIRIIVK